MPKTTAIDKIPPALLAIHSSLFSRTLDDADVLLHKMQRKYRAWMPAKAAAGWLNQRCFLCRSRDSKPLTNRPRTPRRLIAPDFTALQPDSKSGQGFRPRRASKENPVENRNRGEASNRKLTE